MKRTSHQRPGKAASAALQTQSNYTAMEQWLQWCDDNGVVAVPLTLHKWIPTNAPTKSHNNRSLRVMLKDDCIHVKNWAAGGETITFFDNNVQTPAQNLARQVKRLKTRQVEKKQRETAKQQAQILWNETIEAPVSGYMARKKLLATYGARWHVGRQCWMVAMTDVHGNFATIQRIYNEKIRGNDKWFLKGARTNGLMVLLGALHDGIAEVIVCEGFATGATLREKTRVTVACALGCGNLKAVCLAIRAAYPQIYILVCGDDDRRTGRNSGRQKAIDAANAVGGGYCFPTFNANCESCTDFCDTENCPLCGGES